jgi:hypothetical protein
LTIGFLFIILQHFWCKKSKLMHAAATTTTLTSPHHMSNHDNQHFGATQQPTKKSTALQCKLD